MSEGVLSEEHLYEGSESPSTTPFSEIQYIGFSVIHFNDLSQILQCPNLRIAVFRSCGFDSVPKELLRLTKLQKLDLSANRISTLPDSEEWSSLTDLITFDLCDNNITDISEPMKLQCLPKLRQLMLTGNICLSIQDSFTRLALSFPSLVVLNDMVITSQHRAYMSDRAIYSSSSLLPLSKTDDFIFMYVKFMHVSGQTRYIRKFAADNFCLNRVLHRYGSAERIQCLWRGYSQRIRFKIMKNAAETIQCRVRYWYNKRLKAAQKIKSCFLRCRTKRRIKFIRSVKLIQSVWRRKCARRIAVCDIFEVDGEHVMLIAEDALNRFKELLEKFSLNGPDKIERTNIKIVRFSGSKKCSLPGSPIVYFAVNDTLIARRTSQRKIGPGFSCWCNHDHSGPLCFQRASKNGVNWTRICPFVSIPPSKCSKKPNPVSKSTNSTFFVRVVYKNANSFTSVVAKAFETSPEGLVLFPERVVNAVCAQITCQSALRAMHVRRNNFSSLRQTALERRATFCLSAWFRTLKIKRHLRRILSVDRYVQSLPPQAVFYIPNRLFQLLPHIVPVNDRPVEFGFSADKSLVLGQAEDGYLSARIESGRIMFGLSDAESLVRFGTSDARLAAPTFADKPLHKMIRRQRFHRISFASVAEAKKRILLFTWLTGEFGWLMSEQGVIEYCCACSVQALWRSHRVKQTLSYVGIRSAIAVKGDNRTGGPKHKLYFADEHPEQRRRPKRKRLDPVEAIAALRGDYRPTEAAFREYKQRNSHKSQHVEKQSQKHDSLVEEEPVIDLIPSVEVVLPPKKTTKQVIADNKTVSDLSELINHTEKEGIKPIGQSTERNTIFDENPIAYEQIENNNDDLFMSASPKIRSPIRETRTASMLSRPSIVDCVEKNRAFKSTEEVISNLGAKKLKRLLFVVQSPERKNVIPVPKITRIRPKSASIPTSEPLCDINLLTKSKSLYKFLPVKPKREKKERIINTPASEQDKDQIQENEYSDQPQEHVHSNHPNPQHVSEQFFITERAKTIFKRVVRLRQICDQVVQQQTSDNSVQIKKENANRARNFISLGRETVNKIKEQRASEIVCRSRVEKIQLLDELQEIKMQRDEDRKKKISRLKIERVKKMQKIAKANEFGRAFMSASRFAVRMSEAAAKQRSSRSAMAATNEKSTILRASAMQTKIIAKEKIDEITAERRKKALLDRLRTEALRMKRGEAKSEKLERIYEEKRLNKERKKLLGEKFVMVERQVRTEKIDKLEEAFDVIVNDVGSNIGFEEGHLIAAILNEFV